MQNILIIFQNFIFILVCILIFASPFYYLYKRKGHGSIRVHGLNREIENFLTSKQSNYLIFFWALSEALIWFIIPEFLLLLVIFMRTRLKRNILIFDILGTIAGTVLAFVINLPAHLIEKLPYIQPSMVQQTADWFEKNGLFALAYQPFSGIPYKVFAYLGANYHILIIVFIAAAVLVRVARYFIFYTLFNNLYPYLHKFVYRYYVILFVVAVFIFSFLLLQVYQSYDYQYTKGSGGIESLFQQKAEIG
jgi:membrane protein YqaA with SNARE-associated domain